MLHGGVSRAVMETLSWVSRYAYGVLSTAMRGHECCEKEHRFGLTITYCC